MTDEPAPRPTRAQRLVQEKLGEVNSSGRNRRQRRAKKPGRHVGSPTRLSREDKRRRWAEPDAVERQVQELNREMRSVIQSAPPADGLVAGPLTVAARHAAPELAGIWELDDDEHLAAIEQLLVGLWGEAIRALTREQYEAWREACRERVFG